MEEIKHDDIIKRLKEEDLIKVFEEDERMLQITDKGLEKIGVFHNKNKDFFTLLSIYFYLDSITLNK